MKQYTVYRNEEYYGTYKNRLYAEAKIRFLENQGYSAYIQEENVKEKHKEIIGKMR